ncbi:hypothetical protein DERF_000083 [Dermatophagoides farinae]|uniref:Uncharacterized protein n=1 Tax=Dermatophagoides farinae TaxID=6954 RepID=A0A922I9E3_DERFA|nr:hypothetical protein DERF_000083 [Dermatophagoides farinae]
MIRVSMEIHSFDRNICELRNHIRRAKKNFSFQFKINVFFSFDLEKNFQFHVYAKICEVAK